MSKSFKEFLNEAAKDEGMWTEHDGDYSTEASSLKGQKFNCPKCEAPLEQRELKALRHDGEITHWKLACKKCHTLLTVFND